LGAFKVLAVATGMALVSLMTLVSPLLVADDETGEHGDESVTDDPVFHSDLPNGWA